MKYGNVKFCLLMLCNAKIGIHRATMRGKVTLQKYDSTSFFKILFIAIRMTIPEDHSVVPKLISWKEVQIFIGHLFVAHGTYHLTSKFSICR